jgi:hypothetical protein
MTRLAFGAKCSGLIAPLEESGATPDTAPEPPNVSDRFSSDASATPPMPRAAPPRKERRVCFKR